MQKIIYGPLCLIVLVVVLSWNRDVTKGKIISSSKDGWEMLFDGKTTKGWHSYGKTKPSDSWKIKDGAIGLSPGGSEGGDLVTDQEFSNYDLKLEWKISDKGNSGVIFFVHEDPEFKNSWNTGMEMQILDNGTPTRLGHPDGKLYSHRAGDLYDLIASKEAVKPVGQWNEAEIVANKGKLDFFLNGQHTLSTNMWDDNWKKMIAISKFKDMKGFGSYKSGKIALQDHGNAVWFRNIKIKKL
ncbi:MAG: DUF1080 domain-containing protein [Flavisolibacter sp.]